MNDCVFCKIVNRTLDAEILFENEQALAILDINPIHHGHALVLPKVHCSDFLALPPVTFQKMMEAVQVVAKAMTRALKLEGFNIFSNNGRIAGQSVFHFHFHITPRYKNDNIRFVLELKKYANGEMRKYGDLIRQNITTISSKDY